MVKLYALWLAVGIHFLCMGSGQIGQPLIDPDDLEKGAQEIVYTRVIDADQQAAIFEQSTCFGRFFYNRQRWCRPQMYYSRFSAPLEDAHAGTQTHKQLRETGCFPGLLCLLCACTTVGSITPLALVAQGTLPMYVACPIATGVAASGAVCACLCRAHCANERLPREWCMRHIAAEFAQQDPERASELRSQVVGKGLQYPDFLGKPETQTMG